MKWTLPRNQKTQDLTRLDIEEDVVVADLEVATVEERSKEEMVERSSIPRQKESECVKMCLIAGHRRNQRHLDPKQ